MLLLFPRVLRYCSHLDTVRIVGVHGVPRSLVLVRPAVLFLRPWPFHSVDLKLSPVASILPTHEPCGGSRCIAALEWFQHGRCCPASRNTRTVVHSLHLVTRLSSHPLILPSPGPPALGWLSRTQTFWAPYFRLLPLSFPGTKSPHDSLLAPCCCALGVSPLPSVGAAFPTEFPAVPSSRALRLSMLASGPCTNLLWDVVH